MPKMTMRVILKSGVDFAIKCDKFTINRDGFGNVRGYKYVREPEKPKRRKKRE